MKKIFTNLTLKKVQPLLLLAAVFCISVIAVAYLLVRLEGLRTTNPFLEVPLRNPTGTLLFYSEDCPYCGSVDTYIEDHGVEKIVAFTKISIFKNEGNLNLLMEKANLCDLDDDHVGVPFLWDNDGKQCVVGYVDIISFFQERIAKKKQ